MCLGRCPAAPQNLQVFERRQILHLPLHSQALRTFPRLGSTRKLHTPSNFFVPVECLCRIAAALARAQSRHITRLLLHLGKCRVARGLHSGPGRPGSVMGLLQLCFWHVDVSARRLESHANSALIICRYSTMDNVDGKQARRTGTSSPLGELFEYVTIAQRAIPCLTVT